MRKSKIKNNSSDNEDAPVSDSGHEDELGNGDVPKKESPVDESLTEEKDTLPLPKDPPKKRKLRTKASKKVADEGSDEEEEEYEVEEILASKKIKGKVYFLIRWKGYQPESDTWEPENTVACPELVAQFKAQEANGNPPAKRGRPKKKTGGPKSKKSKHDDEEEEEYEVEKIIEVHHKKNGKKEFLIHWKGWAARHDSWEPEENLNCSELIKKFMMKVKAKKSVDSRDLRVAPKSTNRFTLSSKDSGRRLSKRSNNRQRVRYDDTQ